MIRMHSENSYAHRFRERETKKRESKGKDYYY